MDPVLCHVLLDFHKEPSWLLAVDIWLLVPQTVALIQCHSTLPVWASGTCQWTQLAEQIMRRWHAAIPDHFVSGLPPASASFLLSFHSHFHSFCPHFCVFLFRPEPSTFSTLRPPHRDTQTPSDRHLLHHQQRRGAGRVSERGNLVFISQVVPHG